MVIACYALWNPHFICILASYPTVCNKVEPKLSLDFRICSKHCCSNPFELVGAPACPASMCICFHWPDIRLQKTPSGPWHVSAFTHRCGECVCWRPITEKHRNKVHNKTSLQGKVEDHYFWRMPETHSSSGLYLGIPLLGFLPIPTLRSGFLKAYCCLPQLQKDHCLRVNL